MDQRAEKKSLKDKASGRPVCLKNGKLPDAVRKLEKQMILEALIRANWNQRFAAEILRITPRMLAYRLARYGLKDF